MKLVNYNQMQNGMKKLVISLVFILGIYVSVQGQYTTLNAHSHNDYTQKTPFFLAYNAHFGSIEADIWAVNGVLYVAHDSSAITSSRTLESLYLQPIADLFKKAGGKAWIDNPSTFQLLIDLKTATEPTLSLLVELLKKYPGVFDSDRNKNGIPVVITGNRPSPTEFSNYPNNISFDANITLSYDESQLKRVALFSGNLADFIRWRGKAVMTEEEQLKLSQVIDFVHGLHKKIRFWNAPDTQLAWDQLLKLRVDYVNTDHIQELANYLETYKNE
jgi:alkaline phosphatase